MTIFLASHPVIQQNPKPGATNAIPNCEQYEPSRQKTEAIFMSSDNSSFLSAYSAAPGLTPSDDRRSGYHSHASSNQVLKPYGGTFESSNFSVGGFIVTSEVNCGR